MSRSRIITFLPPKAMMPPRLIATKVLPSPLMVEVTAITFFSLSLSKKSRLVLILLKASAITDFGFLSMISCDIGMFLLYLGTIPRSPMLGFICRARSLTSVISLWVIYLPAMSKSITKMANDAPAK